MFRFSSSLLWYSWRTQSGQWFTPVFWKNKVCLVLSEKERNRGVTKTNHFWATQKEYNGYYSLVGYKLCIIIIIIIIRRRRRIIIIIIKEKTFYLATSLNSNSTFFEESTLIGSAVVKCWELYPCNVVPPAFHVGSFSGKTRPGLATSSKLSIYRNNNNNNKNNNVFLFKEK